MASCNHISYRLGNAGAMFNGRCQKEVPCWWASQLMYHWDHSNWEVPWDSTALWPKWLLAELHKWPHSVTWVDTVTWVEWLRELGRGCAITPSSLSSPLPLLIMQIQSGPEENYWSSHFLLIYFIYSSSLHPRLLLYHKNVIQIAFLSKDWLFFVA